MVEIKTTCCGEVICSGFSVRNAVEIAARDEVSLAFADLVCAYLSGLDLRGVDFREANLRGTAFKSARLEGADFRGANLGRADLRWASVQCAKFTRGSLRDSYYRNIEGHWSLYPLGVLSDG